MNWRPFVVAGLAVAGVGCLAGLGWSLLAAAALVALPGDGLRASFKSAWVVGIYARFYTPIYTRLRTVPVDRRTVAAAAMAAGMVVLPVGVGVAAGVGAGLIMLGAAAVGVALLTGWNA